MDEPSEGDSEKYITFIVKDPLKHGENVNAYVTYTISATTNLPFFANGVFSVIRRYSDFEWLHNRLVFEFPGCIIPPLPEKNALGRFGPEFVEQRRRYLEKFLNSIGVFL